MATLLKLIDAALFLFFVTISTAAPLIDAQVLLPSNLHPRFLVNLTNWYVKEFDDYFIVERPHFFVGLIWIELLFQWPLALLCLYGIAASKPWFKTTSLMYGSSTLSGLVALLAELSRSKRGSPKLLGTYLPVLGFSLLAILRGLLPQSKLSAASGIITALKGKKNA